MAETEIKVSQIYPSVTAYQLIGTNSGATGDVYLTLAGTSNEVIVTPSGTTITLSTPQAIGTGSSPTFNSLILTNPLTVGNGGTGDSTLTAYALLTGGTTSTGALQQVSGVGSTGQVLVSAGASAVPVWTTLSTIGVTSITGTTNEVIASSATGAVTLSLPQAIATTSSPTFADLTLTQAGNLNFLINATGVTYSQIQLEGNGTNNYIQTASSGAFNIQGNDGANFLTYNPSSGNLTLAPTTSLVISSNIVATNQTMTIENIIMTGVTSDPVSPAAGQFWFRSDTKQWVGYDGSANVILG